MKSIYRNKKEYAVFAMRRSGHHAIIDWILNNTNGIHCFLNDCDLDGNPFDTYKHGRQEPEPSNNTRDSSIYKDLLIYNFEDKHFNNFPHGKFLENHDKWIGRSQEFHTIIVLRDPFNLLASKFQWFRGQNRKEWKPTPNELSDTPSIWKLYANEFLGKTDFLKNKIGINYNEWFANTRYKKQLSVMLNLDSINKGINEVAKYGANTWGDSFDNLDYDKKATRMNVLRRWQSYIKDNEYKNMLRDEELLSLTNQIYPEMTKTILKHL